VECCCILSRDRAGLGTFAFSQSASDAINTGTTIVTFLMVFLIQNTQNRDAGTINLKLNELIQAIDKARDQMIDIENLSDLELDELQAKYEKIKAECNERQSKNRFGNLPGRQRLNTVLTQCVQWSNPLGRLSVTRTFAPAKRFALTGNYFESGPPIPRLSGHLRARGSGSTRPSESRNT
jgi:low affinity Fe/Cu permease